MTRGKAGHYWRRISPLPPPPFEPFAVVLLSSGTYAVPSGAVTVIAWAVGAGSNGAGGCSYKQWSLTGQEESFSFSVGQGAWGQYTSGGSTSISFRSDTLTANGGAGYQSQSGGSYSGGDGGANGGSATQGEYGSFPYIRRNGGAVGGNDSWSLSIVRMPGTDVSGLFDAVSLAGLKTVEDGGSLPAFGSGGGVGQTVSHKGPGYGGGDALPITDNYTPIGGDGAVVLYFA